jgi:dTDP-4-amino-4,6-dideoxygalactose transaminase
MFHMVAPSAATRDALLAHLRVSQILAVSHYLPLHTSRMGQQLGGRPGDCPVSERIAAAIVRLPFFTTMADAEQDAVIAALTSFRPPS